VVPTPPDLIGLTEAGRRLGVSRWAVRAMVNRGELPGFRVGRLIKVVKDDEGTPLRDDGPVLKANDQLLRVSESWRKLFGLDAPEQLNIALEKRIDDESTDIVEVLLKVIPEVLESLDLDGAFRARVTTFALELAGWHLRSLDVEDPGAPRPEAPRPQLALPPGPSTGPPQDDGDAPPPRHYREPDGADAVLSQLAKFEDEFGPLEDDDDE
jgi:excisionase family DNA binding protein